MYVYYIWCCLRVVVYISLSKMNQSLYISLIMPIICLVVVLCMGSIFYVVLCACTILLHMYGVRLCVCPGVIFLYMYISRAMQIYYYGLLYVLRFVLCI